ncbi:MAG: tetratricopeptide repeat protein [Myxococcota bacterium]
MPDSTMHGARDGAAAPARGEHVGRYVLEEEIGRGGMGVVFAARDPRLDRRVAVKILRRRDRGARKDARLRREARVLARLSHPNIVQVYDVGSWDGRTFVTMALIEGVDLRTWVQRRARPWATVLSAFIDAGTGLAAAHRAGVIHRDFKLSNVMVTPTGQAVVLDFGLAFEWVAAAHDATPAGEPASYDGMPSDDQSRLTRTGAGVIMGTPPYMSPEQHVGEPVTAASDQYSFCIALYEALYGRRVFTGNLMELRDAKLAGLDAAHAFPLLVPRLPRRIEQAIVRGLGPDPAARWPSMAELLAELAPTQRSHRRAWIVAAAAAGVTAIIVSQTPENRCTRVGAETTDRWRHDDRPAVAAAFSDRPGDARLASVLERLDAWHGEWAAARKALCALRGDRPVDTNAWDRQLDCSERQRLEVAALVAALRTGSNQSLDRGVGERLDDPESCGQDASLSLGPPPPARSQLDAVAEVRTRLAQARAQAISGLPGAVRDAAATARAAEAVGYGPLIAEAQYAVGAALWQKGRSDEASAAYEAAYLRAVEAGHNEVAAAAATALTELIGDVLQRPSEGVEWGEHAAAATHRHGDPPRLVVRLLSVTAYARQASGDDEGAEADARRAIELVAEIADDAPEAGTRAHQALATVLLRAGRAKEAIAAARAGVTFATDHLDAAHRRHSIMWGTLGAALIYAEEWPEALEVVERSWALAQASASPESELRAGALTQLGLAHTGMAQLGEAEEAFNMALAIREHAVGTEHIRLVPTLNNLASVYQRQDRLDRAGEVYERAQRIIESQGEVSARMVVTLLVNRCVIAFEQRDHAKARRLADAAMETIAQQMGPDHAVLAFPLTIVGRIAVREEAFVEAIAPLRRALGLRAASNPDSNPADETRLALADALYLSGEDVDEARQLTLAVVNGARRDAERAAELLAERWPDADSK